MSLINRVHVFSVLILAANTAGTAGSNEELLLLELQDFEIAPNTTAGLQDSGKVGLECNSTGNIEWMTDWVPSERIKHWFPVYRLGAEADGTAVYLNMYGRHNFKKLLEEGTAEDLTDLDKYFDYVNNKVICDSAANNGGDGVITILDWDGLSISSYNSPGVIHLTLKQLRRLGELHHAIKETYSINTSFAAQVILNAARPHLGKVVENVHIYGTQREKWMPRLLEAISPSLLPRKYGGTNDNVDI